MQQVTARTALAAASASITPSTCKLGSFTPIIGLCNMVISNSKKQDAAGAAAGAVASNGENKFNRAAKTQPPPSLLLLLPADYCYASIRSLEKYTSMRSQTQVAETAVAEAAAGQQQASSSNKEK